MFPKIFIQKLALLLILVFGGGYLSAYAGSATWTGAASDGQWTTGSNWSSGAVTGSSGGTISGDTATFSTGTGGVQVITVDNGRNIKNITFDGNADSYTLTGGTMKLTGNGTMLLSSTIYGTTPLNSVYTVSTPLSLFGSYTITNNRYFLGSVGVPTFNITGNISTGTAGAAILNVIGGYGSSTTGWAGMTTISGVISDGVGTLGLSVSDIGSSGVYQPLVSLTGSNSYTGGTTINNGILSINSLAALGNFSTSGTLILGQQSQQNPILQYTGTGGVAAGTVNLGYTGTVVGVYSAIDQSGSGLLNFTHDLLVTGTAARLFQLQGSTTGIGQFSGIIADGTSTAVVRLVKTGTGTWILSNANSYTGATSGLAGVLNIQNNTALGTGGVTMSSGAALQLQSGSGITVGNVLNLTGSGINNGGALQSISGSNTYSGAITLAGISRINSDAGTLYLTSVGLSMGSNTLILGGSGNMVVGSVLSGSGGLTKDGAGTVTLTNANPLTGLITLSSGTLSIGDGTAGHDGSIASSSGISVINPLSSLVYNLSSTATRTYSNAIYGQGSLTVAGPGTLTLAGINTFTGATLVTSGSLILSNTAAIGFSPINDSSIANGISLTLSGGVATIAGITGTGTGNFTSIFSNAASISTLVLNPGAGVSNSSSSIINNGLAPMNLTKTGSGTQILTGLNSYTGVTTISSGTLSVSNLANGGGNSGIGASSSGSSNLVFTGSPACLQYTGVSGSTNRDVSIPSGLPQIDVYNPGTNLTWTGIFTPGTGTARTLIKLGAGTLTFSGSSTNTGIAYLTASVGETDLNKSNGAYSAQSLNIDAGALVKDLGSGQLSTYLGYINGTYDLNGCYERVGRWGTTVATGTITNNAALTTSTLTMTTRLGGAAAFAGSIQDGAGKVAFVFGDPSAAPATAGLSTNYNMVFSGTNTYSGATILSGSLATLFAGSTTAFSPNSPYLLTGSGSTLSLTGTAGGTAYNNTIGSLSGSATATVNLSAATLTTGGLNTSSTFQGILSGVGGFTKVGVGTQTLTGTSSYTGATTIVSGELALTVNGRINTSSGVTVSGSATFTNNSSSSFTSPLALNKGATLNGGGAFAPSLIALAADLTGGPGSALINKTAATSLTQAGTLTLTLTGISVGIYNLYSSNSNVSGAFTSLNVNGTDFAGLTGSDLNYTYTLDNTLKQLDIAYVPEPSSWMLFGFGVAFLLLGRRRQSGI